MELDSGGGTQDQVADDLRGSLTGQGVGGIELAVGIAIDNSNLGDHGDGFIIGDGVAIREVLGPGADGHEAHDHNQRQDQREKSLHGVSSFFIFANRPPGLRKPSGLRAGASSPRRACNRPRGPAPGREERRSVRHPLRRFNLAVPPPSVYDFGGFVKKVKKCVFYLFFA